MVVYNTKDLGTVFRNRRQELGFSQAYMTELTGISASFISNFENGKETCEIGKVMYLLNMLGMNIVVEKRA